MPTYATTSIGTNTGASGASLSITVGAAGVPAGKLIVVCVTEKSTSGTNGTVSDSATNTWNTANSGSLANLAADGRGMMFYAWNSKALVNTNTITYNRNLSGSSCAMSAFWVDGISTRADPRDSGANGSGTGTTGTITATSGAPAGSGEYFVGLLCASGTTTAGGNATFTQASGWVTPPNEATTGGSGGSRVDGGNRVGTTGTLTYNPTLSSTAQQWIVLISAFVPAQLWGQATASEAETPLPRQVSINKRRAGARHTTGFRFFPFLPYGWEAIPPQPPTPTRTAKRGAGLRGDDGTEAVFVPPVVTPPPPLWGEFFTVDRYKRPTLISPTWNDPPQPYVFWNNAGSEVQPWQPPHPRPEKFGANVKGEDGTEFPFLQWFNTGWEIQPPPPPHPRRERFGANVRGDDGTEFPFSQWFNQGWPIQEWQPPHKWRRGHGLRGDDGSEAPYIFWNNAGWEVQPPQPPHRWNRGHWFPGDDGSEAPYILWQNSGWEQQYANIRHPLWKSPDIGDSGIEASFVSPIVVTTPAWEFEIPAFQPRHPVYRGQGFGGDDGTVAAFAQWFNAGWEIQYGHVRHRYFKSPDTGDTGAEAALINWVNAGWPVQYTDVRHRFLRSPDIGDRGNELPMPVVAVANTLWPVDIPWLPLRRGPRRNYAALKHQVGFSYLFSQLPPVPLGNWAFNFEQTVSKFRYNRFAGLIGVSQFAAFDMQPVGWETPWLPVRPRSEVRHGAVLRGDDGTEFPLIIPLFYGWENPSPQPPRGRWERRGAYFAGDAGSEFPLIPPTVFVNLWDIPSWQPPRQRWEKAGAVMRADDGIEFPLIIPFPTGWEVLPWPPPRQRWERRGSMLAGDTGIEFPLIIPFVDGWQIQDPQPPRARWERRGSYLRGDDGTEFPLVIPMFYGWEVQPWQPPRRPWERRGAYMQGDFGAEFPLVRLLPYGWEVLPWQPPHPHRERGAMVMRQDEGTEVPFIQPLPVHLIPLPLDFYEIHLRNRGYRAGALVPFGWHAEEPFFPVIPILPRAPDGLVFQLDTVRNAFYGDPPYVGESCSMVLNFGTSLQPGPINIVFVNPNGQVVLGDTRFAFITLVQVQEVWPVPNFVTKQALVYTFGVGELNIPGLWSVTATVGTQRSRPISFRVIPAPDPRRNRYVSNVTR